MQKNEYANIYKNESTHWYYLITHNLIASLINWYSSKKKKNIILDAGCGTGLLMKKMTRFGTVYGIDVNKEAIKFAKKRNLKNVYVGSITKLPFENNFFDIIVSIDVLYHRWVKSDLRALKEFHRVLKPDGLLILKLPAFSWLAGPHDKVVYTKQRYTKKELDKYLNDSNFRILKNSYFFSFILPIVLINRLINLNKDNSDISKASPWINQLLIWLLGWEIRLFRNMSLPLGVSVITVSKNIKDE